MSLSGAYGAADDEQSMQVLKAALDNGAAFWDTASVYGFGHNEELIGRFLKENPGAREKLFIGSKCGWGVRPPRCVADASLTETPNSAQGSPTIPNTFVHTLRTLRGD